MNANEAANVGGTTTSSMRVPRKRREDVGNDDPYPETWDSLHDDDNDGNNLNNNENIASHDALNNTSTNSFEERNGKTDVNNTTDNNNNSSSITHMKTILPKPPSSSEGDFADFPNGVFIPPSVTPDFLSGRLRSMLLQLPVDQINEALKEYDDAARMKDLNIRNHYAYFNGLLRRFLSVHEKVKAGLCTGPMGINLSDRVRQRMKELVAGGYCTEDDMKLDDRVMAKLKLLSESEALLAFDELESVDRSRIRNFGSYFMGIVNRYMRGERNFSGRDSHRRDFGKRPGFTDNNRRDNNRWGNKNNNTRRSRSRSRSPENLRARYGANSNDDNHDRRRDFSRRDTDNKYNDRDYNRDNDFNRRGGNDRNSNRNDQRTAEQYDRFGRNNQRNNRQNNRTGYSPNKNNFNDRNNRDFNDFNSKDNHSSANSVNYYSPSPKLDSAYTNNSNVPAVASNPLNNLSHVQQPQQPFQNNSFFPPANVPGIPLAIPNQAGVTTGYPQFQIPPVSAPQQPPPASGFDARIYQNSNTYQSVQQNKITPNHILPPQNPFNTAPPPQFPQQTVTPPTLNPLAPASAPPPAPTPGGGLDILDIANMAQMFLNQQPQGNVIPPQPPHMLNYSANSVPTGGQNHSFAVNNNKSQYELPVMVKLAVQNLIATGHIDGDLDAGLRRLLNKLPEPVALEALNNYASCDLSRVRNKTGYLGGILKKHHEKATGNRAVW